MAKLLHYCRSYKVYVGRKKEGESENFEVRIPLSGALKSKNKNVLYNDALFHPKRNEDKFPVSAEEESPE